MDIGFSVSNNQGIDSVQSIVDIATTSEEQGLDSIWVSDHVFNASYIYDRIGDKPYYDPLTILTFVAAKTSRIKLGTSILVLPYHHPIRLAKIAATLDHLSNGRLLMGIGVGVIPEEIQSMGVNPRQRGKFSDEAIILMKKLWTDPVVQHSGDFYSVPDFVFSPKPLQTPHIPILIGGTSEAAIKRAARIGNGWHPTANDPETLRAGIELLHHELEKQGRDVSDVPISISIPINSSTRDRNGLGSNPEEIIENSIAFKELGVSRLVASSYTNDLNDIFNNLDILAHHVMPNVK